MSWKRVLGLALCAVALALVVWGLFFAKLDRMVSIKIDLPPAATPKSPPAPKPVDIFIDAKDEIRVDGRPSSLETLASDVAAASTASDKSQQPVRIRATDAVEYETYTAVLKRLGDNGWYKVGLIND
ncbi:ExbD/TolR family protein [Caulobacter sp. DWR2-3-1b2]|uniref:ExbD/TolR family protein n=1 Tax=unclassified Caulobacter TaxID=2648921 RepID=UPI003CF1CDB6